jgi:hypothetical protein
MASSLCFLLICLAGLYFLCFKKPRPEEKKAPEDKEFDQVVQTERDLKDSKPAERVDTD